MRIGLGIASVSFLINCIILIWAIVANSSGEISNGTISQFAIILIFQVLNTICFFVIFESAVSYSNNKVLSRGWDRRIKDEINEHFVRQIIAKMIQEEIKPESLNDLELLKVKATLNKIYRDRKLDDFDTSKNRELMG